MTDREKIIELARTVWSAGDVYIGPDITSLEAFYRAAQAEAFEQAAFECWKANEFGFHRTPSEIDHAIHALKEK